ncbi:ATP synthase E chain-domain-containing protein [Chaetomium fimeti]|uniref:ATP synthase F(0) complex subunit e, mitochondrial n=1 Tax=Chaetomium fimeti TaxID=1854472 RepID=A0AAE0HP18_9PEZI|nr:ATP synthase E chain-domain-containing protein [Chaetomium fimeti]
MSSTSGVNVLRYSVLGLGVVYGFKHQRSINSAQKAAAAQREYEHKQELINKAKSAYAKSKQSTTASAPASSGVNQDLTSPNFDLEAFIEGVMNQK